MDRKIKAQIVLLFGSQAAAAPELGISERRLSRLIHGYDKPRAEELKMFKEKLGVSLSEEIRAT